MKNESNVKLATELTIAWLSNPNTRMSSEDVPAFLRSMNDAVAGLASTKAPITSDEPVEQHTPAVSARKSLASRDVLISLIDGKPYRTLRRHLSGHGLTPDEYRKRYNLKPDYPMVAPGYSEARRDMAKRIGLGRKPKDAAKPATQKVKRGGRGARDAETALGTKA